MLQEIEIEYKNMLTKDEYKRLLTAFPFPKIAKRHVNYYFETKDMSLKNYRSALRIRKKNNVYYLTLKEPHAKGLLETHDQLTEADVKYWLCNQPTSAPHVMRRLRAKNIDLKNLQYFGQLTTDRRIYINKQNVHLILDYSVYNGTFDYELEIEAPNEQIGIYTLKKLLNDYSIRKKYTPSKIERFFSTLLS